VKISEKQAVTISDDCTLKIWKARDDEEFNVDDNINTETTTCLTITGRHLDHLVTGCHSGNIHLQKLVNLSEYKTISNAHQNLIRCLVSVSSL
jgi:WD40 repeat protein